MNTAMSFRTFETGRYSLAFLATFLFAGQAFHSAQAVDKNSPKRHSKVLYKEGSPYGVVPSQGGASDGSLPPSGYVDPNSGNFRPRAGQQSSSVPIYDKVPGQPGGVYGPLPGQGLYEAGPIIPPNAYDDDAGPYWNEAVDDGFVGDLAVFLQNSTSRVASDYLVVSVKESKLKASVSSATKKFWLSMLERYATDLIQWDKARVSKQAGEVLEDLGLVNDGSSKYTKTFKAAAVTGFSDAMYDFLSKKQNEGKLLLPENSRKSKSTAKVKVKSIKVTSINENTSIAEAMMGQYGEAWILAN
ncbi:hypothetical protein Poly51_39560 [Rubripirellula tenax]|uniref:Uncharacterized protein n=1 Tax=Rubripirellula tenax TaxID=2528015 RepID=A0A5C6ELQ7_9BACT|nr:hypothetical protein [Rubripirellula tenax]TWU50663.1 hypothetical protein Poly51_39560 [Rubripirellula tenax]